MFNKHLFAVGCVASLATLYSVAQASPSPDGQSNATANAEEATSPSLVDIDVASYLIRNLYREPDKDTHDLRNWLKGWALSLYWNPVQFINEPSELTMDDFTKTGLGFAVSKDFSPASSFRIGGNYQSGSGLYGTDRVYVMMDYMWNLSNFYYGYDLSRQNEWLLTVGIQGGTSQLKEQSASKYPTTENGDLVKPVKFGKYGFGGAHLGVQYRKNLSNDLAFFMETQFMINSDNWNAINNQYDMDWGVNGLIGLTYRLGAPKRTIEVRPDSVKYNFLDNTFIQMYGGVSKTDGSQYNFMGMGQFDGRFDGMNFGFNIGKWLNPSLGVRLGYFEQAVGHNNTPYIAMEGHTYHSYMTLRGGRAELMLNPLSVFADKVSVGRIGWDLSAGVEVGQVRIHKYGYNNDLTYSEDNSFNNGKKPSVSLTLGTQVHYFVNDHVALFAEGRISSPNYKAADGLFNYRENNGVVADGTKITENVYSASVGLEYYLSGYNRYRRWKYWDNYETKPIDRLENDKRLFVELAGGFGHQVHWGEHFPNMIDYEGAVALGMRYNDYLSARARFSYSLRGQGALGSSYMTEAQGHTSSLYRLSADAMFNFTNLWYGIDYAGTRMGDIYLFAGPAIGKHTDDTFAWGGNVGAQLTRRLSSEWELFLEPRYEFYNGPITNRWDLLAGLIYYYNAEKNSSLKQARTGEAMPQHHDVWFMELGAGAGLNTAIADKGPEGPIAHFAIGRRFNPLSSLRLSGNFELMQKAQSGDGGMHSFKVGVEGDYMFNLTNLWYGIDPDRKTNLRLFAGGFMNVAGITKGGEPVTFPIGLAAGIQWTYRLSPNMDLYIEPRYENNLKRDLGPFKASKYDDRLQLVAGLVFYNRYNTWRANHLFYNGAENYPFAPVESNYIAEGLNMIDPEVHNRNWFWEAAIGATFPMGDFNPELSKIQLFSPALSFGVGYNIDDYQALRVMGNFSKSNNMMYVDDPTSYNMAASLDYRFNVTNWIMGINPYRPMDAYVFVGPEVRLLDWTKKDTKNTFALGAMAGGKLAYHLNSNLDIFAEARYTNYKNLSSISKKMMQEDNDVSYRLHNNMQGLLGITWYNTQFDRNRYLPWDESIRQGNWFYQMAGGISHALRMTDQAASITQSNSLSGFAAMGYSFSPLQSIRFDMTAHVKQNNDFDVDGKRFVAQVGLDYMFNASRFVLGENPYRRFDLQLLAGPQARIVNVNNSEEETGVVAGVTVGGQLQYHLNRNFDLFGEARYDYWTKDWQNRANIYAGVTYYGKTQDQRTHEYITDPTERQGNWFWTALGGVTHPMGGWKEGFSATDLFSPMVSLGLGYTWGPYSSVRFDANVARLRGDYFEGRTMKNRLYGGVDYMFNLTNLMMGQDTYRPIDVYLLGGPMLRLENFFAPDIKNRFAVGGMVGGQLAYHLTNNLDLVGEARYENWEKFGAINDKLEAEDLHNGWELLAGVTWYNKNFDHTHMTSYEPEYRYGNWFYQLGAGLSHPTLARTAGTNESAAGFGAIGYTFDKFSSVRLNGTGMKRLSGDLSQDMEGRKMLASVGLDYMFNVSNFVFGENPYRRFDIQLLAGPTARLIDFNNKENKTYLIYGASAGGQLLYHINKSFDLFGEARYDFWQGSWQERLDAFAGVTYYTKPLDLRSAMGGFHYDRNFDHKKNREEKAAGTTTTAKPKTQKEIQTEIEVAKLPKQRQRAIDRNQYWFTDLRVGATLPMESSFKTMGASDKLGVGYVFGPYSSVRANVIQHWHLKNSLEQEVDKHKFIFAGDMEYMLNLSNLAFGQNPYRRVDLYAFVGPAARLENVTKSQQKLGFRWGLVGGGQANYHINKFVDLFLEGQVEAWSDGKGFPQDPTTNAENRLTGYFGTRVYSNPLLAIQERKAAHNIDDDNTWFFEAGVGLGTSRAPTIGGDDKIFPEFTYHIGAGKHFNDLHAARIRTNFTKLTDAHVEETYERHSFIFELSGDYMFNVTNAILGANPYRRIDAIAFAGPTVRLLGLTRNDESNSKFGLGANAGGQLTYHINNQFDIFGEGRLDYMLTEKQYDGGMFNRYEAMAGLAIRFDKLFGTRAKQYDLNSRLYAQFVAGMQVASTQGANLTFKNSQNSFAIGSPSLDFRMGYRINPVWALQGGIFADAYNFYESKVDDGVAVRMMGVRGELAFSPITMFNPEYNAHEQRFNLVLSGGLQVGNIKADTLMTDFKRSFGLTAAAQAQYRVTDNAWALAEVRANQMVFNGNRIPVMVNLGVQYDLKSNKNNTNTAGNFNRWYVEAGATLYNVARGGYEAALGFNIDETLGIRLKGVSANAGNYDPSHSSTYGYLALEPSFVVNATNIILGKDSYRRLNANVLAGANIMNRGAIQNLKDRQFSKMFDTFHNGIGFHTGLQFDVRLSKSFSLYAESRLMFLGDKTDFVEWDHDNNKMGVMNSIGLKYNLPK